MHAYRRIEMLVDEGTFEEWNKTMEFSNPLNFPGYEKKVQAAKEKTKLDEAIVTGKGMINGHPAVIGVCDARFMMRQHGAYCGRKDYPGCGTGDERTASGDHFRSFRRSQNAGGLSIFDADGENFRCVKEAS